MRPTPWTAFLRRSFVEWQGSDLRRRRIDLQQCDIAFSVDCEHTFDGNHRSVGRMNLSAMRAFDDVSIRDDAIGIDEEPAAAREFFTARVEGFDCDR